MLIRRTHFYSGLAVLAACGIFYFQENTHQSSSDRAREANIASCTREVTRDAYEAAAFLTLSERVGMRDNPGDTESSKRYEAAALSIADTFPKPGTATNSRDMMDVQFVTGPGDIVSFRLTPQAEVLIAAGCRQAF